MVKKKSIFPLTKLSDVISMKSGESITAERITSEGKFLVLVEMGSEDIQLPLHMMEVIH